MEIDNDVIASLQAIEQQVFDANEKKHPSLRMVMAWKKLMGCRESKTEDLIDCHLKFVGVIEMVELSCGEIEPKDSDNEE